MSKKKKSSNSQSSFSFKNFFVMHVEKVVFGFIALIASIVMYVGISAKPYPSTKTPEKLKEQATQVSRDLKVDHWTAMKDEEGRKVDPVFTIAAGDSRRKIDPIPYIADPTGSSKIRLGAKRGDPAILAPEHLEAKYYLGPIAAWAPKIDPLASLDDAKKVEIKPLRNPYGNPGGSDGGFPGGGKSGGSSSGGYAEGSSGMGGGAGMGMPGSDPNLVGRRVLFSGYDRGFYYGMSTFANPMGSMAGGGGYPGGADGGYPGGAGGGGYPGGAGGGGYPGGTGGGGYPGGTEGGNPGGTAGGTGPKPETRKIIARGFGFVCVTALAPHHEMETNYRKEFYDVIGYMEGRDSPNYRGFEVQRVELIDANKEIAEKDWQSLPDANPEKYKESVKKLVGTCSEINPLDWTDPSLSMPIPPILLNDFRKFSTHSKIKYGAPDEGDFPGMGGMGGGYAEGGGMSGGGMSGGYAEGGMGSAGMGGGYGSGSGMPGGYGEGGNMSSGSGSGSGGMPGGFTEGSGYGGSGYGGGGYGGGDGGFGNSGTIMEVPRRLPSTKYKLVRFYDFKAEAGKIYKYRVRLLMYDSNFPEWSALKPASSTLKTETLRRVQTLESEFKAKEPAPKKATNPPTVVAQVKREKYRETEWSAPSKAVLTKKPAMVFATETKEKLECVFVDFEAQRGIGIPKRDAAERGFVFGTLSKQVKGKEVGIDIIHPVTKVIKALKDYRATNFVTVVDWKSPSPLNAMIANPKDAIKTGAEVVSFDPLTGQLVVSREFDNFTSFNMYAQPDLPAVGPLGGGLSAGNANGMSSGYGETGGGGMGGSSMGGGKGGMGMPGN